MFSNCFGGILELSVHRFEAEGNFVTVEACLLCCCVEPLLLLTEERFWTSETVVLHVSESNTFLRVQLIDLNHDGVPVVSQLVRRLDLLDERILGFAVRATEFNSFTNRVRLLL